MKITETISRECCQRQDLKALSQKGYYFCTWCGRHHETVGEMGLAGSTDHHVKPMPWPWEAWENEISGAKKEREAIAKMVEGLKVKIAPYPVESTAEFVTQVLNSIDSLVDAIRKRGKS